ncbi:hypothetical protein GS921_25295 [Rhodococcus hoagii]|nr:hypothetical protein [Prescottella equi]
MNRLGNNPESGDVNDWPVIGSPGSGNLYWQNLVVRGGSAICEKKFGIPTDRCTETDVVTARITVNPATSLSKMDYTTVYSPNNGYFDGYHIQFRSVTSGIDVTSDVVDGDDGNTGSIPTNGFGTKYLGNQVDLHGEPLTIGARLWLQKNSDYYGVGAKTADAQCPSTYYDPNGEPTNGCVY